MASLEPEKFFIGLVDFFSVLLPGSVLAYMLKDDVGPLLLGDRLLEIDGPEAWGVFFFTAYLLGHFIFLLGSVLVDDCVYDPIRQATERRQIEALAKGGLLARPWARRLARSLFNPKLDRAVDQAIRIKERSLAPGSDSGAINAFQWSKARLTLQHPEAIAEVHRFEADSKFFRSLLIVLYFLIPWSLAAGRVEIGIVSLPLLALAGVRYWGQRVKATKQAYWYVMTAEEGSSIGDATEDSSPEAPSHAGGVVFRRTEEGNVEFLLVQASGTKWGQKSAPDWVLPKGHIEPGEHVGEAAVREVHEESGVWARIVGKLDQQHFQTRGERAEDVRVQVYLMESLEARSGERETKWLAFAAARDLATHPETEAALAQAHNLLQAASSSEPPGASLASGPAGRFAAGLLAIAVLAVLLGWISRTDSDQHPLSRDGGGPGASRDDIGGNASFDDGGAGNNNAINSSGPRAGGVDPGTGNGSSDGNPTPTVATDRPVRIWEVVKRQDPLTNLAGILESGSRALAPLFEQVASPGARAVDLTEAFFESLLTAAGDTVGRRAVDGLFDLLDGSDSGGTDEIDGTNEGGARAEEDREQALYVFSFREDQVRFDLDSSTLPPSGQATIKNLRASPGGRRAFWFLIGSTDRSGPEARNQVLAMERVQEVADYLEASGESPFLIASRTVPELASPVPSYDGATDPENRRVEIVMLWVDPSGAR